MDKYEIITKIGKGACGAVFLVRNKQDKKNYALKKIQVDEGRKNRTKETIQKEAKILATLKHPNVVAFHESFFDQNNEYLCIIQDYCDGGTLDEKIMENKRKGDYFPEKQIMQWFIQIAMAVQCMHSKKILHRDLKTQNVFMTKTGNSCKLGDFGISKMMDQTIDVASTCVGTPCYLSPEMCQDIPYSSKADVWALGCLFYEMIALKPAFDANNLISLFYKIVKGDFEELPQIYSESLSEVVKAILVKNPDDRPSVRQILNLPYVKEHLSDFITQKEYQIQMRTLAEQNPAAMNSPSLLRKQTSRPHLSPSEHSPNVRSSLSPIRNRRSNTPDAYFSRQPPKHESARLQVTMPEQIFLAPEASPPTDPREPKHSFRSPTLSKRTQEGKSSWTQQFDCKIESDQRRGRSKQDSGIDVFEYTKTHVTREGKYVCGECGQKFRLKSWLGKHLTSKHIGVTVNVSLLCNDEDVENQEDYQDDFEEDEEEIEEEMTATIKTQMSDIPEELGERARDLSDAEEDIPEDIPADGDPDLTPEVEYADDFEEYASDEDLDEMARYARELHDAADESDDDEIVMDESPSQIISTCSNFLQEQFKRALGKDQYEKVKQKGALDAITEEGFSEGGILMKSARSEACYLASELLRK